MGNWSRCCGLPVKTSREMPLRGTGVSHVGEKGISLSPDLSGGAGPGICRDCAIKVNLCLPRALLDPCVNPAREAEQQAAPSHTAPGWDTIHRSQSKLVQRQEGKRRPPNCKFTSWALILLSQPLNRKGLSPSLTLRPQIPRRLHGDWKWPK